MESLHSLSSKLDAWFRNWTQAQKNLLPVEYHFSLQLFLHPIAFSSNHPIVHLVHHPFSHIFVVPRSLEPILSGLEGLQWMTVKLIWRPSYLPLRLPASNNNATSMWHNLSKNVRGLWKSDQVTYHNLLPRRDNKVNYLLPCLHPPLLTLDHQLHVPPIVNSVALQEPLLLLRIQLM